MQFRILGPLVVEREGAVLDLGAPKQRAVLAFLTAHAGRPVSLDRLIDELWGDQAPPRATASLQAYVSNLRRILEPDRPPRTPATVLVSRAPGYVLDVDAADLDAGRFEQQAEAAEAALAACAFDRALAEAEAGLAEWRGDVLSDFPYEPFAGPVRTRLDELRLHLEEVRADAVLALGRPSEAVDRLVRLTEEHPLRERLWELLMVALYRSGRQADALRAFARAREVLAEEVGLEPGPGLRRLEQQVLEQDPALDAAPGAGHSRADIGPGIVAVPAADAERSIDPTAAPGPPVVGREAELSALRAAWRTAVSGAPSFTTIAGEPGIGKTTLVRALAAEAEADGGMVVWGRNHEQAGSAPLWPWVQIIRSLLDGGATNGGATDTEEEAVLRPLVDGTAHQATGDPDAARLRLFDAITRLLRATSERRPLVVVLDDLQWADSDSLRVLDYLTNELDGGRVMLVATYRDEDAAPGTSLVAALGALARRPGSVRMALPGLGSHDVAELADVVSGVGLEPAAVALLVERTNGNPFFLQELLRLLRSEGRLTADEIVGLDVPAGVRDVVRRRVDRLPEDSQAVLRVAAVVGREFTVDELAVACRLDAEEVLDALDPPLVTALVEEAGPRGDRFRFAHALVGETLADDLSVTRRRRLHARIAEAIEEVHARDLRAQCSRLAHHHAQAAPLGHAAAATRYAVMAARQAHEQAAFDEAARLWLLAHDVAEDDDEAEPRELLDLTIELASALARVGDAGAKRSSAEAIDRALDLGDVPAAVRAARSLTEHTMTWITAEFRNPEDEIVPRLDRILGLLGPDDHASRALMLAVRAPLGYYRDPAEAKRLVAESFAIARQLGDDEVLAACLVQRLSVHHDDDEVTRDDADELIAVSRRIGSEPLEATGLVARLRARWALADAAGAAADLAAAEALLARTPAPLVELQLSYHPVSRLIADGRFEEADREARAIEERCRRVSMWGTERYLIQLLDIRFFQGRLAEIEATVDALVELQPDIGARNFAALARFESGRPDEGRELLERWGGIEPPSDDWRFPVEATAATLLARHVGDTATAAEMYRRLLPREGRLCTSGDLNCEGPVDTYLGINALTVGDRDTARRHLTEAVALARHVGSPTYEAHARLHLAAALDGPDRQAELRRALAIAEPLDMRAVVTAARDGLEA
jgi:DNA-binding SARP family transcriptional activator